MLEVPGKQDCRTDTHVTRDVKEGAASAGSARCVERRRVALRVRVIHDVEFDPQNLGRVYAPPTEVWCDEDGTGRNVHESGNSENCANDRVLREVRLELRNVWGDLRERLAGVRVSRLMFLAEL